MAVAAALRRRILQLHDRGHDQVSIACELLCDWRDVERVLAELDMADLALDVVESGGRAVLDARDDGEAESLVEYTRGMPVTVASRGQAAMQGATPSGDDETGVAPPRTPRRDHPDHIRAPEPAFRDGSALSMDAQPAPVGPEPQAPRSRWSPFGAHSSAKHEAAHCNRAATEAERALIDAAVARGKVTRCAPAWAETLKLDAPNEFTRPGGRVR